MKTVIIGKVVLFLLKAVAKETDNKVDDAVVKVIEEALSLTKE